MFHLRRRGGQVGVGFEPAPPVSPGPPHPGPPPEKTVALLHTCGIPTWGAAVQLPARVDGIPAVHPRCLYVAAGREIFRHQLHHITVLQKMIQWLPAAHRTHPKPQGPWETPNPRASPSQLTGQVSPKLLRSGVFSLILTKSVSAPGASCFLILLQLIVSHLKPHLKPSFLSVLLLTVSPRQEHPGQSSFCFPSVPRAPGMLPGIPQIRTQQVHRVL